MSNDESSDQNPNSIEDAEAQLSSIKLTEHTNERASISIENGSKIDRESTEEVSDTESRSSSSTSFESVAADDVRDGGAVNNSGNGSMEEGSLVRESSEAVADVEVYCDFPPVTAVAAEEFRGGVVRSRNDSEIENRAMEDGKSVLKSTEEEVAEVEDCSEIPLEEVRDGVVRSRNDSEIENRVMEDGKLVLESTEEVVAEVEDCCETPFEEEVRDGVGRSRNNSEIDIDVPSSPSSSGYGREGIVCSWNNSEIENRGMEDGKSVQSTEEEVAEVDDCCDTSLEDEARDGGLRSRNNSEIEIDVPSSPSSSGYVGGMGSSSGTSGNDEIGEDDNINEIGEIRNGDAVDGNAVSQDSWVAGKRHVDEDDASMSWRKRKKHYIILSNSGKPIYSRYGDEHKLAGFSATLQAIISFVENGGDRVNLIRAGKHQVVFVVKGPIYLVCISCTEEPYESLRGQLELIYGQMLLILTKSVNRCFQKNPKFDMTPLLGGTDVVFSSLIHSFGWNPAAFLHAYTCLPLAYVTRQAAGAILQDVADSGVLFAILMCKHKVISLVGAQKACLHPDDMLLLANYVMASESFRTSESFSPICLPRYNPMAFLYAYIHYLDVDTYLVLLTACSDAFHHLRECRIGIEKVLLKSHVLSDIQRSMLDGGMRVEDLPVDTLPRSGSSSPHLGQHVPLSDSSDRFREAHGGIGGPAGLWHFIYRSIYLDQYVSSEFSSPINSSRQQKRLYRAYERLYSSMHDKGTGSHKTQFRRDENYVLLCWVTQDFELYAAFDPLADKALAIKTCNLVCQWVKDVENEIFLLGASPFSW